MALLPQLHGGEQTADADAYRAVFQLDTFHVLPAARNVTYGSQDICLIARGDVNEIKAEIEAKGYPIELGIVERAGACGPIDSIYLRDADENLVEISVYRK